MHRTNEVMIPNRDFFDSYSNEELLEHLIIVPLQGIKKPPNLSNS